MKKQALNKLIYAVLAIGLSVAFLIILFSLTDSDSKSLFTSSQSKVYVSNNFDQKLLTTEPKPLSWSQLLPVGHQSVLEKYNQSSVANDANTDKQPSTEAISDQIFQSISAASDQEYQQAMISTETVSSFNGQFVSLPGFVVPIEFYDNNSPSLVFVVPYYGACIHFPPPPPNQIVFVRLEPSDFEVNLEQPYLIRGVFSEGLFEDIAGTSAYEIEVLDISEYSDNPDDVRQHVN